MRFILYRNLLNIMRHFLIVSFLFFSSVIINAQEKRALLIGIGNYPKEYGWSMIHGQNDIEIIQPTLNALDFQNIIVLRDSDATYSNLQNILYINNSYSFDYQKNSYFISGYAVVVREGNIRKTMAALAL